MVVARFGERREEFQEIVEDAKPDEERSKVMVLRFQMRRAELRRVFEAEARSDEDADGGVVDD